MNWDALGAIGELVGALAVVVTLIYLAVQIRQSTNQSAANMASTVLNEYNRLQEIVISDQQISETLLRMKTDQELSPLQETQLEAYCNRLGTHWFQIQLGYERGLVDEAIYKTMCQDVERIVRDYPGLRTRMLKIASYYDVTEELPILAPIFRNNVEQSETSGIPDNSTES